MNLLALEFSSERRSAAVWTEAGLGGRAEETGGRSVAAFRMIEDALRAARVEREQIDTLAVGLGPGSYTGIRVAISIAQGWQLATNVKLLGISSAECLAAQAHAGGFTGTAHVVMDAQRSELYLASHEITATGWREIEPLRIVSLTDAQARAKNGGMVIGPEATRWFPEARVMFPDAAMLAKLAAPLTNFIPGEQLEPIYLREVSFVKAPPPRVIPGV